MKIVSTKYGSLEFISPKWPLNRHEAEEIAQVKRVMNYISKFPAKNEAEDKEILNWLKQHGVKLHA